MKLIHDNETIIGLLPSDSPARVHTAKTVFEGTKGECVAEAVRLNLLDPQGLTRLSGAPRNPPDPVKGRKAAEMFTSFTAEVQQAFGPAFQAISALSSDSEKAKAIAAVTVPPELEALKASLLAIFA